MAHRCGVEQSDRSRHPADERSICRAGEVAAALLPMSFELPDTFEQRHIGPDDKQRASMLRTIGMPSIDALIDAAIPGSIRLKRPLQLPPAESEHEDPCRLRTLAAKNQQFKPYIGT